MSANVDVSNEFDAAEWQVRVDLAAAYQLVDLYGWSDLSGTHISARVPGTEAFLINPYGMLFDEITASSLVKVDSSGEVLSKTDYPINPAGFVIHSAVHMGREDVHCVLHTHTRAGNAVAMLEEGLLPLSQKALILESFLRYHEYEGIAVNPEERERLVEDLGPDGQLHVDYRGRLPGRGAWVIPSREAVEILQKVITESSSSKAILGAATVAG